MSAAVHNPKFNMHKGCGSRARCPLFISHVALTITFALLGADALAANSPLADAAMNGKRDVVRTLLQRNVDVNAPQVDGTTALHWAVRADDLELADALVAAGAKVSVANRDGVTPLQLASINGSAAMIQKLLKAGADPNVPLNEYGDSALMMAARTGTPDAVKVLIEAGAQVNAKEKWGGTTPLMWAVAERHPDAVKVLIDAGADVNARSNLVRPLNGRGFEGRSPMAPREGQAIEEFASGWLTPLMFAAREGDVASAKLLVGAGAEVNALAGDGKNALGLAIFNGNYEVASFLIDAKSNVNQADTQRFTPLFWAVDRRNMETAPNFPWMVTADPLPLIRKLLDAGADPNALVNNTPRARMREGSPRIVFATPLMRAAFAGDLELCKLLLAYGADPKIVSRDGETMLEAAAGLAFIQGYHRGKPETERLEVVKLFVDLGVDVNQADDYGITALMASANLGHTKVIQYLVDKGADLGAYDLGKKNDGAFGASVEPLMPVDYAIGVGTFVPNNAVIMHEEAVALMMRMMQERGIRHTTSECTLRGFTCAQANVDPKVATPAEIAKMRALQTGNQVQGITGGLQVKDGNPK